MLDDLLFRIRMLLRRSRAETDLDDELQFHVEKEAEKHMAAGMAREAAIRRARVALGGLDQTKEMCRDARGVAWIDIAVRDVRHAFRMLLAKPLFSATIIASLSLGIGANVAIFSLMRVALWKPLAVAHPERIVHLERVSPADPDGGSGYSYVLFRQLREAGKPDGDVIAESGIGFDWYGVTRDARERAAATSVSGNFFSALGVRPFAGRLIQPQDDNAQGGQRIAVLSYGLWSTRFQSDRSIIGRTLYYKEIPYVVVGIAEPEFTGIDAGSPIDIWVPISADVPTNGPVNWLTDPNVFWLRLLARIEPGGNPQRLAARLDKQFRSHLVQAILPGAPSHFKSVIEPQHIYMRPAKAGLSTVGRSYEQPLLILLASVTLVLLICCANVANLILARNQARQSEIAVRRALGASRGRIAFQLFVESLLPAMAGAAIGTVLAVVATRNLIRFLPPSEPPLSFDLAPDSVVLAFAAGLGVATALLFGLLPGFQASRAEEVSALRSGARVSGRSAAGKALVAGQFALSLLLLIGAGLFLNTVRNLRSIDLGFRPENVTEFSLYLSKDMPAARKLRVFDDLRERLNRAPGTVASTWAWPTVYSSAGGWAGAVEVEGRPAVPGEDNVTDMIAAGPDFAAVIGMTLVAGRSMTAREAASNAPVAMINETLARHYFGNMPAIGHRLIMPGGSPAEREIIGVVRDARHHGPRNAPSGTLYVPVFQEEGTFLVRTTAPSASLASFIRNAVSAVDKSAQVDEIRPFDSVVDDEASRERMIAAISTLFGALALLLSAVGLFGVMAYNVARRIPELGIRLALGAQRANVQWLILRETLILIVAGTAVGTGAAFAFTRFAAKMLYGVKPVDVSIFTGAAVILAVVGTVAGFLPAWRASRIDPVTSLRYE